MSTQFALLSNQKTDYKLYSEQLWFCKLYNEYIFWFSWFSICTLFYTSIKQESFLLNFLFTQHVRIYCTEYSWELEMEI